MKIKFTLFVSALLILFGSTKAQINLNPTQVANWNPSMLGTCSATCVAINIPNPNSSNPKGGGNNQINNGNGTNATTYFASACGLNYVLGEVKTGKRYFPAAANQPVAIAIAGIPPCKTILKAFLYVGGSGNGIAFSTTMVNPLATPSVFPMTPIGNHIDKCWGYTGTYNYRADVTALITGNGNYMVSGIPTSISTPGNDMDGASLVIVYTDPTMAYTGHILIGDGCQVGQGGTQTNALTGWSACAASSFAEAFMIISDLQNVGPANLNMNNVAVNMIYPGASQDWWDNIVLSPAPAVTAGQNLANFGCNSNNGDCFNIVTEGLYYRTACLACAVVPLAVTTATTSSCTVGSATAFASGGTGPYSYTWTPSAANTSVITSVAPGSYTVKVADATGCATIQAVVVIPAGSATIGATSATVCPGVGAALTATGALTYTWNPGNIIGPSASFTPAATQVYTVIGSAAGGCTAQATGTITVNPLPVPLPNSNSPICTGGNINLTVNAFPTYTWSGPNAFTSNVQNPIIVSASTLQAGSYTVKVTSALGCTAQAVVVVVVNPSPTITVGNPGPYCPGTTINLTVTAAASYTWTGPLAFTSNAQNPTIANSTTNMAGPYVVTVTAVGGCKSTGTVNVLMNALPTPTATSNAPVCIGQQINLFVNPAASSYTWTGPNVFSSNAQNPTIANAQLVNGGNYIVTVTNAAGCTNTSAVVVAINPLPVVVVNNPTTCVGSTFTLTAITGTAFAWTGPNAFNTPVQNPSFANAQVTHSGNYTVVVTSAQGCTNSAVANVSVIANPTANIVGTNTMCSQNFNASINTTTLTAGGGNSYVWTLPPGFSATPNLSSNPITLTPPVTAVQVVATMTVVATVGTCTNQTVYTVTVNPNPTITVNSASMCAGTQVTLTANNATTYTWSPPTNLNTTTGPVVIANPANTTVYSVIGSSVGCKSQTQNSTVTVVPNPTVVINPNPVLICLGSSINLTASNATTYTWSPNVALTSTNTANTTASPTITTTYSVLGSQATCTNIASITVSVVGLPTVSIAGTNTLCSQNFNGSPNTTTLTASGAATYVWTLPVGFSGSPTLNSNPLVITPPVTSVPIVATMTVLGTAGSCTNQAVYTITVVPNPTIATTSGSMCAGTSVNLTASNATTYTWTPAATLNTPNGPSVIASPAVTTVYSIIGSSVGCKSQTQNATASVVPNPTVTINPNPALICLGSSINLTAAGATTYTWSPNIALTSTNTAFTTANPTVTTTYSVLGSQATCTNLATVQVSVIGLPTVAVVGTNTLCSQNFNGSPNTTTLTASGAGTYVWTLPAGFSGAPTLNSNPLVITPPVTSVPIVATMTVLGTAGTCTNQAVYTITVVPNPTIATTSGSMCAGTSVNLTASNATTYTWSPSATLNTSNGPSVIASPAVTTVYSIIGSSVGCQGQTQNATANVVANPTVVINPNPAVICLGNSINLTAANATTYTWSPNIALTTTLGPNTTANPTVTTTYSVLGSQATCTHVANITVSVLPLPTITIVPSSPTLCMNNFNGSPNTVSLTANGAASYTWNTIVGLTTNTLNGSMIIGTSNGNPIISGSVLGANGTCTSTATFTMNAIPNPIIATTSGSMCAGTSVSLTAANAQTYTWSPSATLNTANGPVVIASPAVTTMYSVIGSSVGCQGQTQNATATVVNNPTVSIAPVTPTICFGGSIVLTANGATNYTWSPNSTISSTVGNAVTVNPTVTTVYSIIGEAATCTNTAARTVTVIPLPIINIGLSNGSMCMNNFNGSVNQINVTASGATTYNWIGFTGIGNSTNSGPNVIVTAIPNTPIGSGTVIGTVGTCTNIASFTVIAIPNPVIAVTSASMCLGTSATLNASGATTYVWSPSNTLNQSTGSSVIGTPANTTVYSVIGTSLNCNSTTQTGTIDVVANPVIVIAPVNPTICAGSAIGLSAFGATNYTWSPSNSLSSAFGANVIASPMVTTNYVVVGEAATCTSTAVRQVSVIQLPTLQAICDRTVICIGDKTNINANGASSYTWTPPYGLSSGSSNFVVANPTSSMNYTLIGTNGICTASLSVPIIVLQKPVLNLTTSAPKICIGNKSTIFASGAQSYSWEPMADSTVANYAIVSPTISTNYTVTGVNFTGTVGCAFTKEILVEVVPQVTASVNNSVVICEGESVRLTAGGSNTYIWVPAAGLSNSLIAQPYASPKITTEYTVRVSNGGNCEGKATVLVKVYPMPVVDAGPDLTFNADEPMYLNAKGTGTLSWILGDGILCKVCPNSQFFTKQSGVYQIQAVSEYGCRATDEVNIEITNEYSVYIPNIFTPNFDGLNDTFLVYGIGISEIQVTIFDRWGEQIYHDDNQTTGWDGTYKDVLSKNDVYSYLVKYTSLDGKKHTKTGHVTLLK